nr:hypothetical protein [Microcoleus sp. FACHB-1515]
MQIQEFVQIEELSHITFIVHDLDRIANFLTAIFDAQEVYCSVDQIFLIAREKFFLIHNIWIAIMEGESLFEKTYNHIAFKLSEPDFEQYVN